MCGIIAYIGNREKHLKSLLYNAVYNSYRGNDGIGFLYAKDGKWHIDKLLNKVNEIYEGELDKDKIEKKLRVGSIEHKVIDREKYEKKQARFKKEMDKLLDTTSNKIFLHHRKASIGSHRIKNLHPIEYNNKYYIHNGTAEAFSVKKWLELLGGEIFKSETDTEVLAVVYNKLKDMNKKPKDIHGFMREMFPNGWGVLLEIDKDGTITLIKDYSRSLWMYINGDKGFILISEPTPHIKDYDKLYYLEPGIYKINCDTEGIDYTIKSKRVLEWWTEALTVKNRVEYNNKCEICQDEKNTLSTFHCDGSKYHGNRTAICYDCMVYIDEESDDDEINSMESERLVYESYLGDEDET